jgi:hypothetical protein
MDLQQAIQEALASVRADPAHQVSPVQRHTILAALEPVTWLTRLPEPTKKRGPLAIAAARYVLPIWDLARPLNMGETSEHHPIDELPHILLRMGDSLLDGTHQGPGVWKTLLDTWDIAHSLRNEERLCDAYYVLRAAFHAVLEALGFDFLTEYGRVIRVTVPDERLDTAGAAAIAFAGYAHPDTQKRLIFWEWWLNEAAKL